MTSVIFRKRFSTDISHLAVKERMNEIAFWLYYYVRHAVGFSCVCAGSTVNRGDPGTAGHEFPVHGLNLSLQAVRR